MVREVRCSENFNVAPGLQDNCCLGHQKSSPRTSAIQPVLNSARIKLLQHLLNLSIFLLDSHQGFLDSLKTLLLVRLVGCTSGVFLLTVVL